MIPSFLNTPAGILLNPSRQYCKGNILVPASTAIPVATAAKSGANDGRTPPISVESTVDACNEIFSLVGIQTTGTNADVTARCKVAISDTCKGQRSMMNRPVLCNHVFGSNEFPFFLSESIFLEPSQTLQFEFFNGSTAGSASFRFMLESRKMQEVNLTRKDIAEEIRKNRRDKEIFYPFWLTQTQDISLGAGGRGVAFFYNTLDQWLSLNYAMASAITTGVAGDTTELFSCEILDPWSQRPLQNQPLVRTCQFGTAQQPYVLPSPWLIPPDGQIQINLNNLVTDQATDVFITFHGVAMYDHPTPAMMREIYKVQQVPRHLSGMRR